MLDFIAFVRRLRMYAAASTIKLPKNTDFSAIERIDLQFPCTWICNTNSFWKFCISGKCFLCYLHVTSTAWEFVTAFLAIYTTFVCLTIGRTHRAGIAQHIHTHTLFSATSIDYCASISFACSLLCAFNRTTSFAYLASHRSHFVHIDLAWFLVNDTSPRFVRYHFGLKIKLFFIVFVWQLAKNTNNFIVLIAD